MKEKILSVKFNTAPLVRQRILNRSDKSTIVVDKNGERTTLWKDKENYPFKLDNSIIVTVDSTKRKFSFKIPEKYVWDGSSIPRIFWTLIGSKEKLQFLTASLVHDYLLEHKHFVLEEVLKNELDMKEFRRLTSLIFREILKDCEVPTIKANIMSWTVQTWQATGEAKKWK